MTRPDTVRPDTVSPDTVADRRRYLEDGLVDVGCDDCGACVRVKKMTEAHTSVQWTGPAAGLCAEFATAGVPRALVPTCVKLRASIERAVREGRLMIGAGVPR
ncbi:MAG TPA: hypothetical protein VJT31_12590 [Rugosimonospora sp.]|nr:hypothetical protein [Rugosimonospora sp.]